MLYFEVYCALYSVLKTTLVIVLYCVSMTVSLPKNPKLTTYMRLFWYPSLINANPAQKIVNWARGPA